MSSNYENAVHGRRRVSLVNDSNANRQQDTRLALELERLEREKQRLTRRKSMVQVQQNNSGSKRRSSLADTRMMRTLSKHDLYLPMERGRRSSVESESTDSSLESPSKTVPYSELFDKARFEKFCSDTRRLSMTSSDVDNLKEQLNISEHDPTGFMGDMNVYLRRSNATTALKSREVNTLKNTTESSDSANLEEGNIMWDNFVHPRTLEEIQS